MNDPVNGIDLLVAIVVICVLAFTLMYAEWRRDDRYRRLERRAHLNIVRRIR